MKLTQHRADICFNVYESPSIKDTKRKRGYEESDRVSSIGLKTKMETDMHDLLSFLVLSKSSLDSFLKK